MHVVCINACKIRKLTEGRRYKVVRVIEGIQEDSNIAYSLYHIINDIGIKRYFSSERFLNELDWRDRQIDKILKCYQH